MYSCWLVMSAVWICIVELCRFKSRRERLVQLESQRKLAVMLLRVVES